MKIILVTWGSYEKTAYPFHQDTLSKIITNFCDIENIEIIEFLGSIYQPQDKIQELPLGEYQPLHDSNGQITDNIDQLSFKLNKFLNDNNLKIKLYNPELGEYYPLMGTYQCILARKGGE
jgi:hypothetical protein